MFDQLAEERIRKAMAAGEFDNLAGAGQPIDLNEYFDLPEATRVGDALLRSAGFIPREIELLKEIAALKKLLAQSSDAEHEALWRDIQARQLYFDVLMERRQASRRRRG
jgi:hypothetical protein